VAPVLVILESMENWHHSLVAAPVLENFSTHHYNKDASNSITGSCFPAAEVPVWDQVMQNTLDSELSYCSCVIVHPSSTRGRPQQSILIVPFFNRQSAVLFPCLGGQKPRNLKREQTKVDNAEAHLILSKLRRPTWIAMRLKPASKSK
jgi:hypothetical protein